MFQRLTVSLLALIALVAVPGCVYYNTFYHATASAREAELMRQSRPPGTDPTAAEMELLERVVEKCGRVVKLHPDSNWADDALVLMGEALYRQSKYESAEERLTEFVALYPESEHRPRAEYFLAAVLLAKGNAVAAEQILTEVAFADPPSELSDDALFLIGDARRKRKRYAEAAEAYLELLERFPRSDRRAAVRFVTAENFVDMGRLDDAVAEFDAVAREKSSRELAFESRLRLTDVLVDVGDTDRALEVLEELERRTTARNDLDRILLARARTHEAVADFEKAMAEYGQVASEHERSEAAAEAHYRIGLIHRDRLMDFDEAVASFRKAKEESPRSETAGLASAAVADIESLREYLAVIEEHEQGAGAAESSSAATRESPPAREAPLDVTDRQGVPERLEPGREDSLGITHDRSLPEDPAPDRGGPFGVDTADSARALSRERDRETPSAVLDSTASEAADAAASGEAAPTADGGAQAELPPSDAWSPWPPPPGPMPAAVDVPIGPAQVFEEESEVAVARLRVAELYLFKLGRPSDAVEYYESVLEEHPTSRLAPKAAYAVAWIAEHRTGDPEGAAMAYRRVVEQFPGTAHAAEAEKAIARLESAGTASGRPVDSSAGVPPGGPAGPPGSAPASD